MAFIRTKNKGGIEYEYLVENYREEGKVRQRVLKYLGPVNPERKSRTRISMHYHIGPGFLPEDAVRRLRRRGLRSDNERMGFHYFQTGESHLYLRRIYEELTGWAGVFEQKVTESLLIRFIIYLDVHETLHHVITFRDDKRGKKGHAAIAALLEGKDRAFEILLEKDFVSRLA
jgi:hypothetical protein